MGGRISYSTGIQRRDVGRCTVRGALHLIEWTGVSTIQSTGGAARGDTGRATGRVDVAGHSRDKEACGNKDPRKLKAFFGRIYIITLGNENAYESLELVDKKLERPPE